MGLNMNYGLLMQGNTSRYKVDTYNSYEKSTLLSEEYLLRTIVDFNNVIRESSYALSHIKESIDETDSVGMVNNIKQITDNVANRVNVVRKANLDFFEGILSKVKELLYNRNDIISQKYRYMERIRLLEKALTAFPKKVYISDIRPTNNILDPNFPDQTVLGNELPEYIVCVVDNIIKNQNNDCRYSIEEMLLKSCRIDTNNDRFLEIPNEATRAFGSSVDMPEELSVNLYNQACDNFEVFDYEKLYSQIDMKKNETNKYYAALVSTLEMCTNNVVNSNGRFDINNRELYYKTIGELSNKIGLMFNKMNRVIAAIYLFNVSKYNRLIKIISDSDAVVKAAHRTIEEYQHLNAGNFINPNPKLEGSDIFNPNDADYKSLLEIQSDFNIYTIYLEEALMENEYQESFIRALSEAEEGTNTDDTQQNAQNNQSDSKQTILQWLNNLLIKFQEALKRFKMRFEEMMIKNNGKRFWEKNKEAIGKINFSDTTVNEWYDYDFENINKASYVKFDINADYMKSDEAFQKKIIDTLGGEANHPKFEEKDTFGDKIKKLMYYQYIKQDNGTPLSNTKFDAQKAYSYIDHIIANGFESEELKKISEDSKNLSDDRQKVNRDYNNLKEQMKQSSAEQSADNTKSEPEKNNIPTGNNNQQQAANTTTNTNNTQQQTATKESAIEEDDFKFNLAHQFGLLIREATFGVGAETAKSASAAGVDSYAKTENKNNKSELDAMIKRCFNLNTIAITARMTAAIAAYKQYMDLYKNVVGNGKAANNKQNNQQQEKK